MIGRNLLFAVLAVALVAQVANALSPAAAGEFPYQVSLRINGHHSCGGALVGYRHVVTSAKCVMDVDDISNLLVITSSVSNVNGGESYAPRKIVIHPDFKRGTTGPNDIAIIALEKAIQYTDNQNIVYLPSHYTPNGVEATLTGWRWLIPSEQSEMEELKKLTVMTKDCTEPTAVGPTEEICASVESGSAECIADNGAPLVSDGVLVGVSSYGNPCTEGSSSVFTNVFHHIQWIFKAIQES